MRRAQAGCAAMFLMCGRLAAQTCLAVSPPTYSSDGTVSFELLCAGASARRRSSGDCGPGVGVSRISIDDGPVLQAAGKASFCAMENGEYHCIIAGANLNPISNGTIAKLTAVLAPGSTTGQIQLARPMAVAADGLLIPAFARMESSTRRQSVPRLQDATGAAERGAVMPVRWEGTKLMVRRMGARPLAILALGWVAAGSMAAQGG